MNISEIDDILSNIEFKSSTVDPIPAKLIKENKDIFLPVLCDIVNASLTSGTMDGTKLAHITPLLKGTGLDTTNLKNYRPISNLSFIGKLIERVVLIRLNEHLDLNNLISLISLVIRKDTVQIVRSVVHTCLQKYKQVFGWSILVNIDV